MSQWMNAGHIYLFNTPLKMMCVFSCRRIIHLCCSTKLGALQSEFKHKAAEAS